MSEMCLDEAQSFESARPALFQIISAKMNNLSSSKLVYGRLTARRFEYFQLTDEERTDETHAIEASLDPLGQEAISYAEHVFDLLEEPTAAATIDDFIERTRTIAIKEATEAKDRGNSDAAKEILRSALLIMNCSGKNTDDTYHEDRAFAHNCVANGVGDEIVYAGAELNDVTILTKKTNGRITECSYVYAPVGNAQSLLQVVTGRRLGIRNIDLDQCESNELTEAFDELYSDDLYALSRMEQRRGDTARASELAQSSVDSLNKDYEPLPAQEIVQLLLYADSLGVDLEACQNKLRAFRQPHETDRPSELAIELDAAMLQLATDGHVEVAHRLLTASANEASRIAQIATPDQQVIAGDLISAQKERQREIRAYLSSLGVGNEMQELIMTSSPDPDNVTTLDADFWHQFKRVDTETQSVLLESASLASISSALPLVKAANMLTDLGTIAKRIDKLNDPAATSKYLSSYSAVVAEFNEQSFEHLTPHDFVNYPDPLDAYKAVVQIGNGNLCPEDLQLFSYINPQDRDSGEYNYEVPDEIYALTGHIVAHFGERRGDNKRFIEIFTEILVGQKDPAGYTETMLTALEILDTASLYSKHKPEYSSLLSRHGPDPADLAEAWLHIINEFPSAEASMVTELYDQCTTYGNDSAIELARAACMAEKILEQEGLTAHEVPKFLFEGFMQVLMGDDCSKKALDTMREVCKMQVANRAIRHDANKDLDLDYFPDVRDYFERAGINDEQAASLINAWTARNPAYMYDFIEMKDVFLKDFNLADFIDERQEHVQNCLQAVQRYIDAFGAEEFSQVIGTFGIHNFQRYPDGRLHQQLLAWRDKTIQPQHITISAHDDWNSALEDIEKYDNVVDSGTTFYFEVGKPVQIAKILVAIGNRERSAGRDPLTDSQIKNVLIDAHANTKGILLSHDSGKLTIGQYNKAANGRQKIKARKNNYHKHVGKHVQFILKACNTAEGEHKATNIARTISEEHNVVVIASKASTFGALILSDENTISFNVYDEFDEKEVIPATVYQQAA